MLLFLETICLRFGNIARRFSAQAVAGCNHSVLSKQREKSALRPQYRHPVARQASPHLALRISAHSYSQDTPSKLVIHLCNKMVKKPLMKGFQG